MNNRVIKFRAWHTEAKQFLRSSSFGNYITPWEAETPYSIFLNHQDIIVLEQFTGLTDKNGTEIYEGDVVRCHVFMGNDKEYSSEACYKVNPLCYRGLELAFLKLYGDSEKNQYPIIQNPSFEYRTLCVDYINQNYNQLAFADCYGQNTMSRTKWKENWYSNDVEVIWNIHQHPELLSNQLNGK